MRERTLKRVATVLAVVGAVALAGTWFMAWRALPAMSGRATVSGIGHRVDIVRDAHAIPHIYGRSAADAYFALGYVHAQDRLLQMDLDRRLAAGTLAEVLGKRALASDRLFRTLGLARLAETNQGTLEREALAALGAYTQGINAWLDGDHALPSEFMLLGAKPGPWRASDSVLLVKLRAFQLSGNWRQELWRLQMSAQLLPAEFDEFSNLRLDAGGVPLERLLNVYDRVGIPVARFTGGGGAGGATLGLGIASDGVEPLGNEPGDLSLGTPVAGLGSNSWAVDGSLTISGKPLLANDVHLALTVPSQWYLAHLDAPELSVVGATLPGVPGVLLGHNGHVAWSFTNTFPDTEDLYLERMDSTRPGMYLTPDGPAAFELRREVIRVRGEPDEILWVRRTRHGPVISDVASPAHLQLPSGYALALSWVGFDVEDQTVAFALRAAMARDADDFVEAASLLRAPTQNVVYADVSGQIGTVTAGNVPKRRSENELKGLVPAPGWLADYDWSGDIPFEEMPQQQQPAAHRIVTANQNVTPAGYPYWLGADWASSDRADRIGRLLDASSRHAIDTFQAIQCDTWSTVAERLLPVMLAALPEPTTPDDRELIDALQNWNRDTRPESIEALVFAAWLRALGQRVFEDELGPLFLQEWWERSEFLNAVLTDAGGQSRWCDDRRTAPRESCQQVVRAAFHGALSYLAERFGSGRRQWSWGRAHVSTARHDVFGGVPLLSRLFNSTAKRGGDGSSVDMGVYSVRDDSTAFSNSVGATFRAIYDLADLERSVAISNSGQSGQVFSSHYLDLASSWAECQYVPLVTERRRVEQHALGTWSLYPFGAQSIF